MELTALCMMFYVSIYWLSRFGNFYISLFTAQNIISCDNLKICRHWGGLNFLFFNLLQVLASHWLAGPRAGSLGRLDCGWLHKTLY